MFYTVELEVTPTLYQGRTMLRVLILSDGSWQMGLRVLEDPGPTPSRQYDLRSHNPWWRSVIITSIPVTRPY